MPSLQLHSTPSSAQDSTASLIARTASSGGVLALPTGRTPLGVYDALARMHRASGLSFAHARAFGLDEYWPIGLRARGAFHLYLHEHFFDRVDLPPSARHVLKGTVADADVAAHCAAYEDSIRAAGGIDLMVLGLGWNGHVAFNEPGSARESRTRRVDLSEGTRGENADAFAAPGDVPRQALTIGIATILEARSLVLLATGAGKAAILRAALEGPIGPAVPASFLRLHRDFTVIATHEAAAQLST